MPAARYAVHECGYALPADRHEMSAGANQVQSERRSHALPGGCYTMPGAGDALPADRYQVSSCADQMPADSDAVRG
jgi:hypothetical protein